MMLVAGLLSVLGAVAVTTAAAPTASATTPGTPGTPQAPTAIYTEDFQNRPGPSPIVRLSGYTGSTGQTYTADTAWLSNCNGWIASANESTTATAPIADCAGQQGSWNTSQRLAQSIGMFHGQTAAAAADNYADTAYTSSNPGAGLVEFQTATNIPFVATDRFLSFSVDVAAANCTVSAPLLQFSLLNSAGVATAAGSQINGCTSATTVTPPALGTSGAAANRVGTYTANGSVLFSGTSVGLRMVNNNASGIGNDHTIDNLQILDVTPQLDKAFSPTSLTTGATSTLTFTITNTSEKAAKNGWSFTDSLPSGLIVTTPAATTTCPSGVVTAPAGGTSVAVTGNLTAAMASCTVTVKVTSGTAATYTNGPSNVTTSGLNPPGTASVTFTAPPVPQVTCNSNPAVFNTGYNAATGTTLPAGSTDAYWTVAGGLSGFNFPTGTTPQTATSLPPAGAVFSPAQVGNVIPAFWAASPYGNAQWISANYSGCRHAESDDR